MRVLEVPPVAAYNVLWPLTCVDRLPPEQKARLEGAHLPRGVTLVAQLVADRVCTTGGEGPADLPPGGATP